MDLDHIKSSVEEINRLRWDFETAHSLEDQLYRRFVEHVAEQGGELGAMAKQVLKTKEIDFPRYTA